MTDKKYTNEDIISSLKVIATTGNCNECKIRNCKWGTCNCEQITTNAALDLITHQQVENKRLEKEVNLVSIQFQDLQERYEEAQAEIERLESANDEKFRQWDMLAEKSKQHYADLYEEAKDILKSEAYKEFAERIKLSIKANVVETLCNDVKGVYNAEHVLDDIDNLLKEMVGEEK